MSFLLITFNLISSLNLNFFNQRRQQKSFVFAFRMIFKHERQSRMSQEQKGDENKCVAFRCHLSFFPFQ